MKKINCLLLIIILILSCITVLNELDRGIVIVLKDASIILTATIPFIFNKIFNRKLSDGFIFTYLIFIFLAHYLGVICECYNKWSGFDKLTHTMSGVLTAYVAALLIPKDNKAWFNILFILAFSSMIAFLWETFEFTCNLLVGGDAQRVVETGVTDTMLDMIVAFVGASLFSLIYYLKEARKWKKKF